MGLAVGWTHSPALEGSPQQETGVGSLAPFKSRGPTPSIPWVGKVQQFVQSPRVCDSTRPPIRSQGARGGCPPRLGPHRPAGRSRDVGLAAVEFPGQVARGGAARDPHHGELLGVARGGARVGAGARVLPQHGVCGPRRTQSGPPAGRVGVKGGAGGDGRQEACPHPGPGWRSPCTAGGCTLARCLG